MKELELGHTYTEEELALLIHDGDWPSSYDSVIQGNNSAREAEDKDDWSNAILDAQAEDAERLEQERVYPEGGADYWYDGLSASGGSMCFTEILPDGLRLSDGAGCLRFTTDEELRAEIEEEGK